MDIQVSARAYMDKARETLTGDSLARMQHLQLLPQSDGGLRAHVYDLCDSMCVCVCVRL